MSDKDVIEKKKCLRCGHTWFPRKPGRPMFCPNRSCPNPYYWDRPPVKKKEEAIHGAN